MSQLTGVIREERPTVLIVDDLESNLELMEAIFLKEGFRTLVAPDAFSALRIFRYNKVDLAILDVMMPGMDGYELCKHMKETSGKQFFPVILLTALTDRNSKIKGLESGAEDFISKPFDDVELVTKVKSLIRLKNLHDELEHSENIIMTLAVAMEARDPYTKGHSTRVGKMAKSFASYLGFSKKEQEQLRKAGILHDIGKISLSTSLLCKKENLNKDEMEAIKRHTIVGEEICRPLISMREVLPVIRSHHERWDGRGFPDGLRGEKIPLNARILSIIDTFDAMVSRRPYREGMSINKAVSIFMEERDYGQWDPGLVDYFLSMMESMGEDRIKEWLNLQ
ncbi:MAG: HD domain-containing phosphohydrolase [Thermodesulfovibrionales bacterium]